jgi:hypothetical protein
MDAVKLKARAQAHARTRARANSMARAKTRAARETAAARDASRAIAATVESQLTTEHLGAARRIARLKDFHAQRDVATSKMLAAKAKRTLAYATREVESAVVERVAADRAFLASGSRITLEAYKAATLFAIAKHQVMLTKEGEVAGAVQVYADSRDEAARVAITAAAASAAAVAWGL